VQLCFGLNSVIGSSKYCKGNLCSTKDREFVHWVKVYRSLSKMLLPYKSLARRVWCVNRFMSYHLDFWLINKLLNYLITTFNSPERSDSPGGLQSLHSNICRDKTAGDRSPHLVTGLEWVELYLHSPICLYVMRRNNFTWFRIARLIFISWSETRQLRMAR